MSPSETVRPAHRETHKVPQSVRGRKESLGTEEGGGITEDLGKRQHLTRAWNDTPEPSRLKRHSACKGPEV